MRAFDGVFASWRNEPERVVAWTPGNSVTNALYIHIGLDVKPTIVVSGVNVTNTGILAIFKDALGSLAAGYLEIFDITALVHNKALFDVPGVTFIEYPEIKSSWLKRLHFEYYECLYLSQRIRPYLWLAMHDMTPNVRARIRAVYCHNPAAFYPFRAKEALLDWKFGLFVLFYRFLYGINIRSNDFVVVQQDWIRSVFQSRYGVRNVVVAHPSVEHLAIPLADNSLSHLGSCYRFFYPAYPRPFKNIEQLLKAVRRLEVSGFRRFEMWLTTNGTETRYAAEIASEYSDLTTVRWLGLLPRSKVLSLYAKADCLVFPSKLETWGMPITEFKLTGKPILAANLPYAHETVGDYQQAAFFEIGGEEQLAEMMKQAAGGGPVFGAVAAQEIAQPFTQNWGELWEMLLRQ